MRQTSEATNRYGYGKLYYNPNQPQRYSMHTRHFLSVLVFVFLAAPSVTRSTSLQVANLQELIRNSERIFTGKCLTVVSGLDAKGLPYTQYGFRVIEMFRGSPSDLVTVKQFGYSSNPGGPTQNVIRIAGMPEYSPEHTYLIFRGPKSSLGFSAPIGLFQGAFWVSDTKQVVNALGNRNLTFVRSGQAALSPASADDSDLVRGPVSYLRFKTLIQQLLGGERIPLSSMASRLKGASR